MYARFCKIETVLAHLLLWMVILLVFWASISRWLGYPIPWSVDFAQLLFIWLSFLGANKTLREGGHISVDMLIKRTPHWFRFATKVIIDLSIIFFLAWVIYYGYKLTGLNLKRKFSDSNIPYAFVTAAVPIGCLLLLTTFVRRTVQSWRELTGGPRDGRA